MVGGGSFLSISCQSFCVVGFLDLSHNSSSSREYLGACGSLDTDADSKVNSFIVCDRKTHPLASPPFERVPSELEPHAFGGPTARVLGVSTFRPGLTPLRALWRVDCSVEGHHLDPEQTTPWIVVTITPDHSPGSRLINLNLDSGSSSPLEDLASFSLTPNLDGTYQETRRLLLDDDTLTSHKK